MRHTKGLWQVVHGENMVGVVENIRVTDDARIADCDFDWLPSDECMANAFLIAAAPELLSACKRAARILEEHSQYDGGETSEETEAMKECLQAIAKSEGLA